MRNKGFVLIAILCSVIGRGYSLPDGPGKLLSQLQIPEFSDAALQSIEKELKTDAALKHRVIATLPRLMSGATDYEVLANDSHLAGDLKIEACIPQLLSLFIKGDAMGGGTTLTKITRLENDPAGSALVKIGDPAIPSLKGPLSSPDEQQRRKAVLALVNIGSPNALATLQEHRPAENDKSLQQLIDSRQ